ncbi:hypothetical protein [uncultured Nostoc sp.]|uniref:hypothetical protein n=1 Tax=uncultured Nostoc sp. TaxID=340711 RepID=UPI0035CB1962
MLAERYRLQNHAAEMAALHELSDGAWLNQSIILPNLTQIGSKMPLLAMQSVSC